MTEEDFKKKLNPAQYRVLREKGTEEAHTGIYHNSDERGLYTCAACGYALFFSFRKFDAKNGWPAFKAAVSKKHIELERDAVGTEVRCAQCHSHLGYFDDEKKYFRINSLALSFIELGELDQDDGSGDEKNEKNLQTNQAPQTVKNISFAAGGIVLGAGATALILTTQAALLLCQDLGLTSAPKSTPTAAQIVVIPKQQTSSGIIKNQNAPLSTPRATTSASTPTNNSAPLSSQSATATDTKPEIIPSETPPNSDVPTNSGTGTI